MTNVLKIDFVSDVSCPWCAVGLASLQTVAAGAAMPSFSRFGNADGFWLQTQRLRAKAA
jgi:hypothetical protein